MPKPTWDWVKASEVKTGDVVGGYYIVDSVFTPLGSNHDVLFINYRTYEGGKLFTGFLAWDGDTPVRIRA